MIILEIRLNLILHIMGIFNHVSKYKSTTNIQSGSISCDLIFSDDVRNDDLNNYYKKSEPIDVRGNKITSLGEPTEATDAINRNFFFIADLLQLLQI